MRRSTSKPALRREPYFLELEEPEANERCLLDQVADGSAKTEANNRMAEYRFDQMFPECRTYKYDPSAAMIFGECDRYAHFALDGYWYMRPMSPFHGQMLMLLRAFWMEVRT